VNGLYTKITPSGPVGPLLTANPNLNNPTRLSHAQALTCDQDHAYTPEQEAVDGGKMDKFVQYTETATCTGTPTTPYGAPGLVMDYYDGNTVTGLWNYAQHYALSDNNFDTRSARPRPARSTSSRATTAPATRSARAPARRAGPELGQRAEQQRAWHHLR